MKPATALLIAVCISTVCAALPLSLIGGRLTPEVAWISLAAGVAAAVMYWIKTPASRPVKMTWREVLACSLFALFALRAFCWLVYWDGDSLRVLSRNNIGDLPLHLTYIRYLARGPKFWPENPIYSGVPLHYPAGIDIFNALLSLAGCDDLRALIWVGLILSAATCYTLLRWGRWFAVTGFLCSGGLAGWKFFHHFKYQLQDFQQDVAWKSVPLSMFVTQRGLLYAIPAGLLLLTTWRARWFRPADEKEPSTQLPQWVQIALYGTMPIFHLHTFLFLSALLGFWMALGRKGTRLRQEALDLVLWAVLPATICVSLVAGLKPGGSAASVIHWHPGWMQDKDNFFVFWLVNLGAVPLFVIALVIFCGTSIRKNVDVSQNLLFFVACWCAVGAFAGLKALSFIVHVLHAQIPPAAAIAMIGLGVAALLAAALLFATLPADTASRDTLAFVIPSVIVFLICCFVSFAPWEWDNMKLMIWSCLAILPFLHEMLHRIPEETLPSVRYTAYIVLFFSGFISLLGGLGGDGYEIAKRSELDPVSFAVRHLPPEATFAAWPTYNHPLLLCGCKVVEGYDGHLFSHGINYQPRLDALKDLMDGDGDWRGIADSLHVRYLFWGSREEDSYPLSTGPWKSLPVAAAGDWGAIYDLGTTEVKEAPAPPGG